MHSQCHAEQNQASYGAHFHRTINTTGRRSPSTRGSFGTQEICSSSEWHHTAQCNTHLPRLCWPNEMRDLSCPCLFPFLGEALSVLDNIREQVMFCLKLFPEISETTVWFDTGPVKDLVTSYLCTQCDGKRASEPMGTWFRASCFPIFSVPIFLSPMNLKL